jgi:hypothetical protein
VGKEREPRKEHKCTSIGRCGGFYAKTPEAAHAYLLTTQPEPGDPREHMHQATITSLGLVEDRLRKRSPENKSQTILAKPNILRGQGKGKRQVPILAKPNKRLIRRRKAQGAKGGCKEYHSTNESKQCTLYVEGRKL